MKQKMVKFDGIEGILPPHAMSYVPQGEGIVRCGDAINQSPTLRENLHAALTNPEVTEFYINNPGIGNYLNTVILSEDGSKSRYMWIEKPKYRFVRQGLEYFEGKIKILYRQPFGWVCPVKDGKYKGKDYWVAWDLNENGGFARRTIIYYEEAVERFKEAGLDARLVSIQDLDSLDHALPPISSYFPVARLSTEEDGPLSIETGSQSGFRRSNELIGYVTSSDI